MAGGPCPSPRTGTDDSVFVDTRVRVHRGGGYAMELDDMILVSFADQAPKVTKRDDGTEIWRFDGKEATNIGLNAVAGRPMEEYGIEPTSFAEIRSGCYDIHDRVRDMDANGVIASMCFPSFPQLCGQLFAKANDKSLGLAVLQAYNDWHVEEWCGSY